MIKLSTSLLFCLILTLFFPFSLESLVYTLTGLFIIFIFSACIFPNLRATCGLSLIGIIIALSLSLPKLNHYQSTYYALPQTAHYQFRIIKILDNNQTVEAVIKNDHLLAGYAIRIYNIQDNNLLLNGVYCAQLTIRPNRARENFYQFSQRLQHLANNRIGTATVKTPLQLLQKPSSMTDIRLSIANYFQKSTYKNAGVMSALTVGLTNEISAQTWDVFRQTGTIHLLSISGLHLTFIALWCFIILRIIFGILMLQKPAPYQIAALLSLGFAIIYALLAGMSLPTQRALIMFSILMMALLMRYPILSIESLSTALLIVLIISPFAVITIGFWLSFVSVLILILLNQYRFPTLISLLLIQCIISTLAIPIVGSFFGEVSLISPIANLFAIPWTTIFVLPSLLIGAIFLPIFPSFSELLFNVSDWSITQLLQFLSIMNRLPYSHIDVPHIPILTAIGTTLLALLLLTKIPPHIKIYCSLGLAITIATLFQYDDEEYLLLFPVGEGLSAFLKTHNTTLLFDTGRYYRGFDSGKNIIIPALNSIGIQSPDYLILSHDNQQHVGGTRSIRRAYPATKVVSHTSLNGIIDQGKSCNDFTIRTQNLVIEPLNTHKSCAFKVMLNQQLLWLIADITPQEWQVLLRDNKKPNMILFPNQGRSKGFTIPDNWEDVIFLASTQKTHQEYQTSSMLNAYDGAIKAIISDKGLTIKHANDSMRFWWMRPIDPV